MSSSTIGPNNAAAVYGARPIFNALIPAEGPKQVAVLADLTTATEFEIDLQQTVAQKQMSVVQSVWIDNSANSDVTIFSIEETIYEIHAPPNSQGWYVVLAGNAPKFIVSSTGGVTVPIILLNVPVPSNDWNGDTGGSSSAIVSPVDSAGNVLVDVAPALANWASFSGTTPDPAASTALFPANTARKFVMIKAPETGDFWVNPLGGLAGVDFADCFKIPMGSLYENYPGEPVIGAWTFFCVAVSVQYTAFAR